MVISRFSSNFNSAVVGFSGFGVSGWSPLIERVFLDVRRCFAVTKLGSRGIFEWVRGNWWVVL